jgi:hypothetical protein
LAVFVEEGPHVLGHAWGEGLLVTYRCDVIRVQPREVGGVREALGVGGLFGSRLCRLKWERT